MCGILCDFHTVKIGLCRTRPYAKWKSRHLEFICQTAFFDDSGRVTLLVYPIQLCVLVCACMCGMCVVCILYEFVCVLMCVLLCPYAACMCTDLCVYVCAMCICVCGMCIFAIWVCVWAIMYAWVCCGVGVGTCVYVCGHVYASVFGVCGCVYVCTCDVNSCVSVCLCVCACVFLQHTKIFPSISQPLDT